MAINPDYQGVAVIVPPWYIPDKPVNHQLEIKASRNEPIYVQGVAIPPPSIGVLSALEQVESKFFMSPYACVGIDVAIAICICVEKEQTTRDIDAYVKGNKAPLSERACKYLKCTTEVEDYHLLIEWITQITFAGFSMLHGGKAAAPSEFLFGAETIADITKFAGEYMGTTHHDAVWNTSLCSVGFMVATYAKEQGSKKVYRQKDIDYLVNVITPEAVRREKAGELHEWQKMRPDICPLSVVQIQNNPEVLKEFEMVFEEFKKKHNLKDR